MQVPCKECSKPVKVNNFYTPGLDVTCLDCFGKKWQPKPPTGGSIVKPPKQDIINSPDHYTAGGIETIDYIRAKTEGMSGFEGYLVGSILKYVSRYKHKNGLEDLKKAGWFLDELIELVEGGK